MSSNQSLYAVNAAGAVALGGGCVVLFLLMLILKPLMLIWGLNGLGVAEVNYSFWNCIYSLAIVIAVSSSGNTCNCSKK